MKTIIFFCFLLISIIIHAQESYELIPYPNNLTKLEGCFEFKTELTVTVPAGFKPELDLMSEIFAEEYSVRLKPSPKGKIIFRMNPQLKEEEYTIEVKEKGVIAEASSPAGCFWAFQTIRQLLTLQGNGNYTIACCKIKDKPAFPWRGIMLDVVRTFRQKSSIKALLDEMVLLKMNVFHWHLTDDQGWRIEISKYPKLTGIGAWRDTSSVLSYPLSPYRVATWGNIPPPVYSNKPNGGYYTKDDIREIVSYAMKRHITIIPEIEMPGHCSAAIASYPWLGSNDHVKKVPTKAKPAALNLANEKVCLFMEDVLMEVMDLFPGKIIHIGGDEVKQKAWQDNEMIRSYMEKNGLQNYSDLQMKFINRIGNFVAGKGERMMGWNEIYGKSLGKDEYLTDDSNDKLNKQTIVHFWRGSPEVLKEVVENGYDIVYSDNRYTYTTFSEDKIPLSKAYSTSPIPQGINPENIKHILGVECPMWSENSLRTIGFYPYIFPRIAAFAEVGWTNESNKDYTRFTGSLWKLKKHWDEKGILYSDRVD